MVKRAKILKRTRHEAPDTPRGTPGEVAESMLDAPLPMLRTSILTTTAVNTSAKGPISKQSHRNKKNSTVRCPSSHDQKGAGGSDITTEDQSLFA